jgi:hypothetical protein
MFLNKYGAATLPDDLDKALHAKVTEIAAMTKDFDHIDTRIFEQVAVSALTMSFAEIRLRKASEQRKKEKANG